MIQNINELLSSYGLSESIAQIISYLILITGIALIAIISNYITKRILLTIVNTFIKKSRTNWDDALVKRKVFSRLSHLSPAIVIYFTASYIPQTQTFVEQLAVAYMLFIGLGVWNGFLSAVVDIYDSYKISREKPIKGFIQVLKIISFILVAIYVISILINRSPLVLFSGLGALSAVILLIFKDSILGLVAGIQLSANDMVRRGDWIEMPKYGADGDVIDVTLNTVKIQNWDKTIVTIPAYSLISDSFKNWRGMSESGGRRIKRTITIDMNTIKFCTEQIIQKFKKIKFLAEYISNKETELKNYNEENQIDNSTLVNGRHLTNIGTFRAYLFSYLRNHPKIHQDMTFLVRHLQPTDKGLPIEIYIFSNDQRWVEYEDIQADIFDHILAVLPEFELRVFQQPTGNDFKKLSQ